MLIALTLMVAMSVHAGKDTLAMEQSALVYNTCIISCYIAHIIITAHIYSTNILCGDVSLTLYMYILTDIDECMEYSPCDVNATCNNTIGSFNCECNIGYSGDGMNCSSTSPSHSFSVYISLLLPQFVCVTM